MEHNDKGNNDLTSVDIYPIVPNESLDMICEDQRSYMKNDFSLNQEFEYSKKDIFMENVQDEFWEENFSMDEESEYIEKFIFDGETQDDMELVEEKFYEIIYDIHELFFRFSKWCFECRIYENKKKHINHDVELRKLEDQSFKIEDIYRYPGEG